MTIWKFPLELDDQQVISMPEGSQILTVQTQDGIPCLWALVDEGAEKEDRVIYTIGTGGPFADDPEDLVYVGTYQLPNLVFHIFIPK